MESEQYLTPKKGGIEKLITNEKDIDKVIEGKKTATRRNGRYADSGEVMTLRGYKYMIDKVYRQTLGEVTELNARQEGYRDLNAYRESILSIHPGMKWLPDMKVWVHEFSILESSLQK